jgi:hypothetical protein
MHIYNRISFEQETPNYVTWSNHLGTWHGNSGICTCSPSNSTRDGDGRQDGARRGLLSNNNMASSYSSFDSGCDNGSFPAKTHQDLASIKILASPPLYGEVSKTCKKSHDTKVGPQKHFLPTLDGRTQEVVICLRYFAIFWPCTWA